jgi:hypothetical protein
MTVLEIVKAKLTEPMPTDAILEIHIEEVGQSIKNYCNRTDIPVELNFVHANMVADYIKGEERRASPDDNRVVTSIKEGDVQVSFGGNRSTLGESVTVNLLHNYTSQLNKYRKVRW